MGKLFLLFTTCCTVHSHIQLGILFSQSWERNCHRMFGTVFLQECIYLISVPIYQTNIPSSYNLFISGFIQQRWSSTLQWWTEGRPYFVLGSSKPRASSAPPEAGSVDQPADPVWVCRRLCHLRGNRWLRQNLGCTRFRYVTPFSFNSVYSQNRYRIEL